MPLRLWLTLLGLTLLAAILRSRGLIANTFHGDEALFSTWARQVASGHDLLLQHQPIDKPPLQFYVQALSYSLIGPGDIAMRLPGFVASMLTVPAVGRLAWKITADETTTLLAVTFLVSSPLVIQFSGTAFIDPLLTLWLVLALVTALEARPTGEGARRAGMFLGLAVAAKHQGWLFLPLVVGIGLIADWRRVAWRNWLTGLSALVFALVLWDVARTGHVSLWSAQVSSFGGIRPAWSWELVPRLIAWLSLARFTMAFSFSALIVPAVLLAVFRPLDSDLRPLGNYERLLALFVISYFAAHMLLAIPAWDRYLLPITSIVVLPMARFISLLGKVLSSRWASLRLTAQFPGWLGLAAIGSLLAPSAWQARQAAYPVGGLRSADSGAAELAAVIYDAPYGTVLYDHWFSWQWRYQLLDRRVFVSWFPHPRALAEDLAVFGREPGLRYIVLPTGDRSRPILRTVDEAGFRLEPVKRVFPSGGGPGMTLYLILVKQ